MIASFHYLYGEHIFQVILISKVSGRLNYCLLKLKQHAIILHVKN